MKKIVVTGGCGFIGSEVVRQLLAKGYEVTVVDDLSKPESAIKDGYRFVRADLTDVEAARAALRGHDVCIHLAAKIGGIGYFHRLPATILSENNRMFSSVFSAMVSEQIPRIIYVSSSMVFESATTFPSREEDLVQTTLPKSAYGFSKLTGEWYCKAFHDEYGLPYSIVRPFNAYGPLEAPHDEVGYAHVIPDLVKKMLDGQHPLELLGDGSQRRCFTHVRDIAVGLITTMEHEQAINQDFNISSPTETSIRELANLLWSLLGHTEPLQITSVPGFTYDVQRRVPDVTKAKQLLGWEADISLEKGLPEVVEWLRSNIRKAV